MRWHAVLCLVQCVHSVTRERTGTQNPHTGSGAAQNRTGQRSRVPVRRKMPDNGAVVLSSTERAVLRTALYVLGVFMVLIVLVVVCSLCTSTAGAGRSATRKLYTPQLEHGGADAVRHGMRYEDV